MKNTRLDDYQKGVLFVLASTCCYGFMPVITKLAFQTGMPTLTLIFSRFGTANLLYLLYLKSQKISVYVTKKQFLFLIGLGILGAISTYGMNASYHYLPSGVASIMTMTYIIVIVLCEMLAGREPVKPFRLVCLALAFTGILLILLIPGKTGGISQRGVFLGLIGAVFYAIQIMAVNSHCIRRLPTEVIFLFESIPLLVSCATLALLQGVPLLPSTPAQFGYILLLAGVNSFIAMISFYKAVRLIGASSASLFGTAEPLISCIAGVLIMHDALSTGNILGGAMILGSILTLNLIERKNNDNSGKETVNQHE